MMENASFPDQKNWRGAVRSQRANPKFWRYYTLSFLLIVTSASWVANLGANWLQVTFLGLTLFYLMLDFPYGAIRKQLLSTWFLLSISVLCVALLRSGPPKAFDNLFLINIFLAFLAASTVRSEQQVAIRAFLLLMFHFCVTSLLLFPLVFVANELIIPIPDGLQSFFQGEINVNRRFYTLFGVAYFVANYGVGEIWRNQSIFWEPGMLGFFAILALALSDAIGGEAKQKRIFILTVITTFAPGAYALLIIYFGLRILRVAQMGVWYSAATLVLFVVLAAGAIPLLREVLLVLFGRDIYTDNSMIIRITDFWLPYVVALKSPFLGHGSINAYQDSMLIAINHQMSGITNSVGAYFYRYGYLCALDMVCLVLRQHNDRDRHYWTLRLGIDHVF